MGGGASKRTLAAPKAKDAEKLFKEADVNKDGKLSVDELVQLAARYGEQTQAAWSKETIEATIMQFDTDGDYQLNRSEWKLALAQLAKNAQPKKGAAGSGGKAPSADASTGTRGASEADVKETLGAAPVLTAVQHVSWSEGLRHKTHTSVSELVATFGAGIGTALCSRACDGDGEHTVTLHILSADTFLTLGMAPAESADWGKNLGTVESSIGLRDDGVLSRNTRFGMEQGKFSIGDTVRMEYKSGRLRWYHGASKLSLLLAEAEGVPYGWHFGVSGMSAQVKIIEGMPSLTEVEQKVLETRQKVCCALKQGPSTFLETTTP